MVLSLLVTFILVVLVSMILRAVLLKEPVKPQSDALKSIDGSKAAHILSEAVQCRTISHQDSSQTDWSEFARLGQLFSDSFPLCETHRITEGVGTYNRVYRFQGTNTEAKPILLTAHLDVVGVREQDWSQGPFAGTIKDGYLWGRGSFDCKVQAIAILTAFEELLKRNARPKTTFFVAFGCDEECNGSGHGATMIASYFEQQGLQFAFVLDEGGVVSQRYIKGYDEDIAVVGVAEKGYMDIELSSVCKAGHSSTPSFPTALGILGRAVNRLEEKQMKAKLTLPVKQMLVTLGKSGSFAYRMLFLNLWITRPLLFLIFAKNPTLNALIRTTIVPTMLVASDKSNVIAEEARATVNVRLLPTQTEEDVLTFIRKTIRDSNIKITVLRSTLPSLISNTESETFRHLKDRINSCFDHTLTTPYLMLGATDARKYQNLSKNIYRFTALRMERSEVDRMHAKDERISLENISLAVNFYTALIEA